MIHFHSSFWYRTWAANLLSILKPCQKAHPQTPAFALHLPSRTLWDTFFIVILEHVWCKNNNINHFYISVDQYFTITQRFFIKVICCKLWLDEDLLMTRYIFSFLSTLWAYFVCTPSMLKNYCNLRKNLVDSLM